MGVIPIGAGEGTGEKLRSTGPVEGTSTSGSKPSSKSPEIRIPNAMVIEGCALCRNYVLDFCKECQATDLFSSADGEDCSVAYGACNHSFHFHCLSDWLKTHSTCPLDDILWEYQWYAR